MGKAVFAGFMLIFGLVGGIYSAQAQTDPAASSAAAPLSGDLSPRDKAQEIKPLSAARQGAEIQPMSEARQGAEIKIKPTIGQIARANAAMQLIFRQVQECARFEAAQAGLSADNFHVALGEGDVYDAGTVDNVYCMGNIADEQGLALARQGANKQADERSETRRKRKASDERGETRRKQKAADGDKAAAAVELQRAIGSLCAVCLAKYYPCLDKAEKQARLECLLNAPLKNASGK